MFRLVTILTNIAAWLLKPLVSRRILETWKPIHLCWWYEKHGRPIPKYFIGVAGGWQTPSVTTDEVSAESTTVIYAVGTTTDPHPVDRPVTERGFLWMEGAGTPTESDNVVVEGGTGAGTFSSNIVNRVPGQTYSVRAYAINGSGTGYGDTLQVTMPEHINAEGALANIGQTLNADGYMRDKGVLYYHNGTEWVESEILSYDTEWTAGMMK